MGIGMLPDSLQISMAIPRTLADTGKTAHNSSMNLKRTNKAET